MLLIIGLIIFLLTGCTAGVFDTQDLMHPPKATGDKAEIQKVIEKKAGKDITLKYPQRGEYRSPITMIDLDGNGTQQAIAFFSVNSEKTGTHIMVIDKVDGVFKVIGDFSNQGAEVDKLCFGDVDQDGAKEIIVGWSAFHNVPNRLTAYSYEKNHVSEVEVNETYTDFVMMDFDDDSSQEILLLSLSNLGAPASAELIKIDPQKNSFHVVDVVTMDSEIIKYVAVTVGKVDPEQVGIVIDAARSGNKISTEMVYWNRTTQTLETPLYDPQTPDIRYAKRESTISSRDINNDGIIEIPQMEVLPGDYTQKNSFICYLTKWTQYNVRNKESVIVDNMVINESSGYGFVIPERWLGKITVKIDTENQIMTFSEWVVNESNVAAAGAAILTIQVFDQNEWEQVPEKQQEFMVLSTQNKKVYAASVPEKAHPLVLTQDEIRNNFKIGPVS